MSKPTKVPIQATGYKASVTNPEHWSHFDYALDVWRQQRVSCDGIGFVFSASDPYCGIDLDKVWQGEADEGPPWATQILERFADTYCEISPSGKGIKIWSRATPSHCGCWKVGAGQIEIYDRARYFTMTGRAGTARIVTDHQADIDSLIAYLGPKSTTVPRAIGEKIPHGTQHHMLVSLAGTMWRRGMTAEAIEAALQIVNAQQCERPGPPENIHQIVASMKRWA
jgi:primase-polymerase (primpol)-like protein